MRGAESIAVVPCAFVFLGPAGAATRKAPRGPRAVIDKIYSHEGTLTLDPEDRDRYFSRAVVALWAKADAAADGGLVIDFDLASNSQGMEVASFKAKTTHADATHESVVVSLVPRDDYIRHSPKDNVVRYDFIREGGHWMIDDMSSTVDGPPWTLRGLLGGR